MKIKLSFALAAAIAMALAASPADAAGKKKSGKSKGAKVTVEKSSGPYYTASSQVCFANAATWWFPIAAIASVGCGIVYAVPVAAEGFLVPQGGGKK